MQPPCFAVDRMLGRLARWLRLLGFDTSYRPDLPGARLLTLAAREGRIVVTRDARLGRRRPDLSVILIHGDRFREQLRELDAQVALGGVEDRLSRCSLCNALLEALAAAETPPAVPPYVRETQSDFRRCPACRRVYWPATHRTRILAEIDALRLTRSAA